MLIDMPRKLPMFCYRERTRHGKPIFYFRRGKGARKRLPDFGSAEFWEAYQDSLAGSTTPKPAKPGKGSLASLIAEYRLSSAFHGYSKATMRQRDNIFLNIIRNAGNQPYKAVSKAHILEIREKMVDRPAQARNWLDALRGLFRWAEEMGKVNADPTLGVRNPRRPKGDGFIKWTEQDVKQYRDYWPLGTHERVWAEVLIGCGARRGDVVTLGKQHIKEGILQFRTEKGGQQVVAYAPIPQTMLDAIAIGPCGDLTFIVGRSGRAFTKESFGNAFKKAAVEAGILEKSAHGLRKYAASCYAENSVSDAELEVMFGWARGSQMAAHYTREAAKEAIARNAAKRVAEG